MTKALEMFLNLITLKNMHPPLLISKFCFFMINIISLTLILDPQSVYANDGNFSSCSARFHCGDIKDISYPFWGLDRPESCGYPGFRLNCNENRETEITIMSATYRVLDINNGTQMIHVARTDYSENICPTHLINSTFNPSFNLDTAQDIRLYYGCQRYAGSENLTGIQASGIFNQFECSNMIGYYVTKDITQAYFGSLATVIRSYLGSACENSVNVPVPDSEVRFVEENPETLNEALREGFWLKWSANDGSCSRCMESGGQCGHNPISLAFICYCSNGTYPEKCSQTQPVTGSSDGFSSKAKLAIGLGVTGVAILVLTASLVAFRLKKESLSRGMLMKLQRGKKKQRERIEAFILQYGSELAPKRYFYSDIKKITKSFKDELGQGGYGTVYKGKLPDDRLVAVKLLNDTKGTGEEFVNEVASISRTSHINVVAFIGFCYEGSIRALIYEFMPNGSLDKFICNRASLDESHQLDLQTLYDIAVGIARGLEYLHRGCNTRILHFDIKPHNILLDDNFCPKISDFGLAKLCERKESIISKISARGTIGYIAPEVFYRSFGGVSHKSDVYSYGMMVLEMFGEKENVRCQASGTDFPLSIYERIKGGADLNLQGMTVENEELTRKMMIVSLWCIQINPSDRPSMTKVLEMLQGSIESLSIPPTPYLFFPPRSTENSITTSFFHTIQLPG